MFVPPPCFISIFVHRPSVLCNCVCNCAKLSTCSTIVYASPLFWRTSSGWCKRVLLSKGKPGSYYQAVHVNSWTGSKSRCVIFSYFVVFVCSDFGEREVGWTLQIQSCHHLSTWSLKCTQLLLQQYLPTFITTIDPEKYHYHLKSGSYQIFNDSEGVCRL